MDSIISVKDLTVKFKDFTAVDAISFEVKKGEIFGFLGPNGAGKSTTIKVLTTLLAPSHGEITLNGYNPLHDQGQPGPLRDGQHLRHPWWRRISVRRRVR